MSAAVVYDVLGWLFSLASPLLAIVVGIGLLFMVVGVVGGGRRG